jgi:hypothetical protein
MHNGLSKSEAFPSQFQQEFTVFTVSTVDRWVGGDYRIQDPACIINSPNRVLAWWEKTRTVKTAEKPTQFSMRIKTV